MGEETGGGDGSEMGSVTKKENKNQRPAPHPRGDQQHAFTQ